MGIIGFERPCFSTKLLNLSEGLRRFGLNPRDWQVRETTNGVLMIQHLHEPELTLQGQAYTQGHTWDWQEISLSAV